MVTLVEEELEFSFPAGSSARKFDTQGESQPLGMKRVDFILENNGRMLFIEVKDVSTRTKQKSKKGINEQIQIKDWLTGAFVEKARDSYTILHLLAEDKAPIDYIVLIVTDNPLDAPLLLSWKETLLSRLRKEGSKAWVIEYVKNVQVLDLDRFRKIPGFSVSRQRKN